MGTQSQIQVLQLLQPLPLSQKRTLIFNGVRLNSIPFKPSSNLSLQNPKKRLSIVLASGEDTASTSTSVSAEEATEADPENLEYVGQIKRVLELLRKNRDMLFSEVKLTIMIEDPRDAERRRLLGIEESDGPSREDLAAALEEVNEGKIPENRVTLRLLAEEMMQWPNLEVEAEKKKPSKSLYAKATDTGIDPREAARRLNMEWDTAAEIEDSDDKEETEVPKALRHHKPDDDHENFYYANGFAEIQVCRSLSRNDNVQREKQISIDPISFRESPKVNGFLELPASLLPGKPKFLSCSLPNSANSSPRSKSCAEGRSFSPSDDLDLWLQKPDVSDQYGNKKHRNSFPRARKSNDSARHVRFSTASPQSFPASPTCITPRLRKAREDFNAFLEAQSA
uniref:Uncharacterized protein n=1 Tax=Cannabis sativa TaxID=3483 RepID=A0A803QF64_CANSA